MIALRTLCTRGRRFLLVCALAALCAATALAAPGQYRFSSLSFENAEIATVLKAMADISGADIVIGPAVKGQITIRLQNKSVEEALQVITQLSGLGYRVTNNTYMVNTLQALGQPIEEGGAGYDVVTLKSLAPAEVIAALSITYKDIQVKELKGQRLVLTGNIKRIEAARKFIGEIDVATAEDPGPQLEIIESIYAVKALVPWQVKQYLENLFGVRSLTVSYAPNRQGEGGTPTTTPAVGGPGTPAIPATPTTWESKDLILRGPKTVVDEAMTSLAKLDVEQVMEETRCSVQRIYATHAIAYLLERFEKKGLTVLTAPMISMASLPTESTGTTGATAAPTTTGQIGALVRRDKDGKLNVDEPIKDFVLRGPAPVIAEAVSALAKIDVGEELIERVHTLRYLELKEVEGKLKAIYAAEGLRVYTAPAHRGSTPDVVDNAAGSEGSTSGSTTVPQLNDIYDLVLRGPASVVNKAVALLDSLDVEPQQISIRSEILSINSSEINNLGIQWPGAISATLTEAESSDPLQLGRIVRSPISFTATLNALQSKNKARVINRPSTVVQNGRTALIHVGDKIFYETVTAVTNTGPVYSTLSVDTGVTLKVRPMISRDEVITLEITSNVADTPTFRKGASGADLPAFKENASTTVVQVRNGETLVIGGLRQSRIETERQEVPFFGKLPLVGGFFRSVKKTPSETELLILVTPSMMKSSTTPPVPPTP